MNPSTGFVAEAASTSAPASDAGPESVPPSGVGCGGVEAEAKGTAVAAGPSPGAWPTPEAARLDLQARR